jgi:2-polyprenyl-3-methyl-5-hydroxy-6-metoxy-1,4-benzoquinol methylase
VERPALAVSRGALRAVSASMLAPPPRRSAPEILDDPGISDAVRLRSMADVERSNAIFGGRRAVVNAIVRLLPANRFTGPLTLLDVGSGAGDVPAAVRAEAAARGVQMRVVALDLIPSLARRSGERAHHAVCADALQLPIATGSVHFATCSMLLHHFTSEGVVRLLSELNRVSRLAVVVSDLRRSRIAALGFWLAAHPLGFHPVTRRDGTHSVLRGFTPGELGALLKCATGQDIRVERSLGWRLTASWSKAGVEVIP